MEFNLDYFKGRIEKIGLEADFAHTLDIDNVDVFAVLILPNNLIIHESSYENYMSIDSHNTTIRIVGSVDIGFMDHSGTFICKDVTCREDICDLSKMDAVIIWDPSCYDDGERSNLDCEITEAYGDAWRDNSVAGWVQGIAEKCNVKDNKKVDEDVIENKKLFYF